MCTFKKLLTISGRVGVAILFSASLALPFSPPVQLTAPPSGTDVDSFVPEGFPLTLSVPVLNQVSSVTSFSASTLTFEVSCLTEELSQLHILLLEFDSEGKLRRVDGWARAEDLNPGKAVDITLSLERRVPPGNRLVLTSDAVIGLEKRWETDLVGVSSVAAGLQSQSPKVSLIQQKSLPPESGASLCSVGYRRAMLLAQAGDGSGITSYTCNQQERSFQFTFNGKFLGQ